MPEDSKRRPDICNALVHLTRDRLERETSEYILSEGVEKTVPAFEVLKKILKEGKIRGSGNQGFVKGNRNAVCFSEAPLSAVSAFAAAPDQKTSRYSVYGVAISKKAVFAQGGRPVIYLPDEEGAWIPAEQKWRHVRFELGSVDYTHEREWRSPGDFDLSLVPGIYVLVWSATEAKRIYQLSFPISKLIRGVLPMQHLAEFV
ncbi:MAG: hypothetical protein AAF458_03195 [Pseudomonadota bacterium]